MSDEYGTAAVFCYNWQTCNFLPGTVSQYAFVHNIDKHIMVEQGVIGLTILVSLSLTPGTILSVSAISLAPQRWLTVQAKPRPFNENCVLMKGVQSDAHGIFGIFCYCFF